MNTTSGVGPLPKIVLVTCKQGPIAEYGHLFCKWVTLDVSHRMAVDLPHASIINIATLGCLPGKFIQTVKLRAEVTAGTASSRAEAMRSCARFSAVTDHVDGLCGDIPTSH